ncbi:DsbA family protein [Solihabitans fulvus]|nr:DsbA family protein [Solihabitans fulvus]
MRRTELLAALPEVSAQPGSADTAQHALRCYFSFRSPYSWLAHRKLGRCLPLLAGAMEWLPFLEPAEGAGPAVRLPDALACAPVTLALASCGPGVRPVDARTTAERGASRWEVPHLVWLAVPEHRRFAFTDAVYRARWVRGEDVCDRGVLAALVTGLALPADLVDAVDDPGIRDCARGLRQRTDADGVFGVPFFVAGQDAYWGMDRMAAFVAHSGYALPESRPGCVTPEF